MGFWTAIVGALIGGFIALTAQLISSRAQLMERSEDRRRERRQLGYALLFKLQQTVITLENLSKHIDSHYGETATLTVGGLLSEYDIFPDLLDFTPNEFALLAIWDERALISSLQKLSRTYRTEVEFVKIYNLERAALSRLLPQTVLFAKDGITLTQKQRHFFAPHIIALDSTLDAINRRLPATLSLAKSCQLAVSTAVERKLLIKLEDRERGVKVKHVRRKHLPSPQPPPQQGA